MKFTKDEAVEKLTAVLTNGGKKSLRMSERSLKEQTEDLMSLLDNDEMELDTFVAKVKSQFERFNSNVEHDVSEGIRKAAETKKPESEKKKEIEGDGVLSDREKKLLERLEALERKSAEAEARTLAETKRGQVKAYLKEKNVDDDWLDNILDLVPFSADTDVAESGESLLGRYNKMVASRGGVTRTPGLPEGGAGAQADFSDIIARRKASQENLEV